MPVIVPRRAWRQSSNYQASGMGSTPGTSVPTHATVNSTKGAATQLIASLAHDVCELEIYISNYGLATTSSKGMVDILIGSSLTTVLIADLLSGAAGGSAVLGEGGKSWRFPIWIPAGTRLGAQAAGERTGVSLRVGVRCYEAPPSGGMVATKVVTYRGGSAVPDAVAVTASNGGEGSWTQIVASTSEDHWGCLVGFQPPTDTSLTPNKQYLLDVGIGAATEELLGGYEQGYLFRYGTGELCEGPLTGNGPILAPIPSGSRLTARLATNGAADAAAPQVALYCLSG